MIRKATLQDVSIITKIYNHYVIHDIATFALLPISEAQLIKAFKQSITWLVYEENNQVIGYAYASAWKERTAYKNSVECSVYLKHTHLNKGIGTQLYTALFSELKQSNFHTVIGGVSLPNEQSIRLHEKFGFKKVAHFKEVGFKFGKWIDVGYWQLILNEKE